MDESGRSPAASFVSSDEVLDYWFGASGSVEQGSTRALWFTKSLAIDDEIRGRFAPTVQAVLDGRLDTWASTPRGALALIIVLDQFTRNIFRDTPLAFSGDKKALAIARQLTGREDDRLLSLFERWFVYMPFEHSESIEDQDAGLGLFRQLAREGLGDPLSWAERHRNVIRQFGRFPHRNEILGRSSTPAEVEFLKQSGSRF